ncbi:MAG: hypothetical protein H7Y04_03970, partial [Verrucomicrobia bacterium]|nr:hypothetical protein [Cytophagales bacterium]
MTTFWNQLLNTALLGTDKQNFDNQHLPENLKALLEKNISKDKETDFLRAAILAWQYQRAGQVSEKLTLPQFKPCEPETQTYCPVPAQVVLKTLIDEEELNINLLKLFLQKCHEKNWVAPPEFVVRLLNLAKDKKYKSLQKQLFKLTGKRGEWLAQFKPDWNFVQAVDYAKVWDEGKGQERLEMFVDLRKADPEKARQLLQKTWQQEAYNTKTALVNGFKNNLSQEDEPFLQQIFEEIQIARTKKKDVYADLLKTVVDLLLSL